MTRHPQPRRFATTREREQHEEMERQRERRRRIFAAIEQSPPGAICEDCAGQPFALFCSDCTERIEKLAGI